MRSTDDNHKERTFAIYYISSKINSQLSFLVLCLDIPNERNVKVRGQGCQYDKNIERKKIKTVIEKSKEWENQID